MPQLKRPDVKTYLKPGKLGLSQGDSADFTITGPHLENSNAQGKTLVSIPVKMKSSDGGEQDGLFTLNLTHQQLLIDTLGDNSDTWVGATFRAIVVTRPNPSAGGAPSPTWQIVEKSIKPNTRKAK